MRPEIVIQSGHTLGIADLAFAPNDQFVATAGNDETVRLWDLRVGCEFRVLSGHQGPVYAVRYAPNGTYLASGGFDKAPILWDSASGAILRILEPCCQPVSTLEFDRTGSRLLAASQVYYGDGDLLLWNMADRALIRRLPMHYESQDSQCAALSPDGSTLAVFFRKPHRIVLYDVSSGQEKATIAVRDPPGGDEPDRGTGGLVFSEDGLALVRAGEADQPDWIPIDAGVYGPPRVVSTGLKNVGWLERMSDGSLLMLGNAGFECWDAQANHCVARGVGSIRALSADGALTATSRGRVLLVNDAATGAVIYQLGERPNTPTELGNLGRHYAVSSNPIYPMIAAAAPDGHVRLWDLRSGRGPTIFKAGAGRIQNLTFSPNGKMLATAASPICIWDVWTAGLLAEIETEEPPRYLAFSPNSTVLVALGRRSLTVVDTLQHHYQSRPLKLERDPSGIVFEPGTNRFFVASQAGEWLRFQLGEDIPQARKHPASIGAVANSAGGLAVVYSHHRWREGLLRSMAGENYPGPKPQTLISLLGSGAPEPATLMGGSPYAVAAAVSPEGRAVATACGGGELNVWTTPSPQVPRAWMAHPGGATAVAWTSDGRFLVSTGMDGGVRLWHADSYELAATLVSFSDADYVIAVTDGSYTATRGGLAGVVFRIDGLAVPFDQFDLSLNRPDRVLDSLGYAYHDLIDVLALAHERRAQRMGVQPPEWGAELRLPLLRQLSPPPPLVTADAECAVRVQAVATQAPLSRLLVYANDVPYPDRHGLDLDPAARVMERELSIPLGNGANRIEISALDVRGTESLRQVIQTRRGTDVTGRLFILAVGVSSYREPALSLRYAAKDAQDIAQALSRYQRNFSQVLTRLLIDHTATRKALLASRTFLQDTQVDDQIVFFLAGHGALFDGAYYFLPHDFDPAKPGATGVSYGCIEALLDGIAARRRLVLMDTCHAGEEDLVEPQPSGPVQPLGTNVRAYRHIGPQRRQQYAQAAGLTDRVLEGLFADLRRGAGAFVIAASGAAEYAVESPQLSNGVFTHSVLRALHDSADHPERGGLLPVSDLHRHVSREVVQLTGGRQRPMSRRENLRNDFSVI
jgi:WD40 repeat protein